VDTVLRNLPVPEVYLQEDTDENGETIISIVDGQQRIRTLLEFARGEVELMETFTPGRDEETWDDLSPEERKAFWNYRIQTREIDSASDADLRDLFRRLNQNTVTLNAQEIRNARFKGDFIQTVTDLADEDFWAESRIVSAKEIRRMVDIEYMAELLVGLMHGPQNKKSTLEGMFEQYDKGIPDKKAWLARFEDARATTATLVSKLADTRWRGKSDYYSLFLACDQLLRQGSLRKNRTAQATKALASFGTAVSERLTKKGSTGRVPKAVRRYALAVEKAASDKDRRETRHRILVELLSPYFAKGR
jgi:hypothetical protein